MWCAKVLAVVAAFKDEIRGFLRNGKFRVVQKANDLMTYESEGWPEVVVIEGAVGKDKAEFATRNVIKKYKPDFVISAGFAGGVREGLSAGDVFICDQLYSIEGPYAIWRSEDAVKKASHSEATISEILGDAANSIESYRTCSCLSIPQFVLNSEMKSWIGSTFPVSIIDMESFWVSDVASEFDIPHVVVRSVLDPVDQELPAFVADTVGTSRNRAWERALKYLVTRPADAPKLIHLAFQVRTAGASLSDFLTGLTALRN